MTEPVCNGRCLKPPPSSIVEGALQGGDFVVDATCPVHGVAVLLRGLEPCRELGSLDSLQSPVEPGAMQENLPALTPATKRRKNNKRAGTNRKRSGIKRRCV